MYDAIVVGARVAGASTAMLLARKGYKVLLVDRATFPSDIPHGHVIHKHGPRRLQNWGLLDRVLATNCPPVMEMTLDDGEVSLTGKELIVDGIPLGCGPRRWALDKVLVDAAVEAGAELREGFAVQDLLTDDDRVTGITGRDRQGGAVVTEKATVTVGADGRNSPTARSVQAPAYETTPPLTCWYFSYWSGVPRGGLEVYVRERKVLIGFPTNDGLFGLAVGWSADQLARVRTDIEGEFMAAVDLVPDLAEHIRVGRRQERFYGATDLPNFYRKPYGAGWALVGDAGCHKDPFLALGICDAMRDAELLASGLDDGLSGRKSLDEALRSYELRRNQASGPDYQQNLRSAQFMAAAPEVRQLLRALEGNQEETNRFFMAQEGMIRPDLFFNPDNMRRIIGK